MMMLILLALVAPQRGVADPRPKCWLHVGPHKTGTTFIQYSIMETKDSLASLGVYLPVCAACAATMPVKHWAAFGVQLKDGTTTSQCHEV